MTTNNNVTDVRVWGAVVAAADTVFSGGEKKAREGVE